MTNILNIKPPAIHLKCIDSGQRFWWSGGKLYTEEEYLNDLELRRMYSNRDPRLPEDK